MNIESNGGNGVISMSANGINENGMAAMKWLERSNNNRNIMAKISMAWHRSVMAAMAAS
jgi:hypothetical protein